MSLIAPGLWVLGACLMVVPLAAQGRRCQLQVDHVAREGVRTRVLAVASENYFAGGDVRLSCRGQAVRIWSDSIASYGGQVVQFVGNFRYEDETAKVTSDFGTYYKDQERWEADGNVHYLNTKDGSKLDGPVAIYRRRIKGINEQQEVYAERRPTMTLAAKDSANRPAEPYAVVGDRIRMRGEDLMWAGGNVTVDRSDIRGRGDSLQLDSGKGNGALIGHASIHRAVNDSFALSGRRIDLALSKRELTGVTGRDSALLTSKDLDLSAQSIHLKLENRSVTQTTAWGKPQRPRALSDDYEIRGDSLAVDTPSEVLKELRAYRGAWVGFKADSAKGERDWLSGDSVVAVFAPRNTGSTAKASLQSLEARQQAASFYRLPGGKNPGGRPTLNYATADRILLTMQPGDSVKVERVEMFGHVEGMQLQPQAAKTDSTKRDSTAAKPDTARRPLTPAKPSAPPRPTVVKPA